MNAVSVAHAALPSWVGLIIPVAVFGGLFIALAFAAANDVINESRDEANRRKRQQP
jgi:4-hydroxybenzoate polyprenyltransferase